VLPVIIALGLAGTGLWAYEKYIDTDPAPIQNINIEAPPEVGGDYTLDSIIGQQATPGSGGGGAGAGIAGLSTGALLALGGAAYFLTK